MKSNEHRTGLEIAVIGMAGRFPGSDHIEDFWSNLVGGIESVTFLTDEELEQAGVSAETRQNKNYVKSCGGILKNRDLFDAEFFEYTPAEADLMHPQTRIFHECTWEALENAGYDPGRYQQRIGLFAAAGSSFDWEVSTRLSGKRGQYGDYASWLLESQSFMPTRVSYKLNLTGPSVLLHSTCSSSLVAIDAACRSLLTGQCEMALAGGIHVGTTRREGYFYQEGMILSEDGHCKTFDAEASGTIGGEGVGIVVLKPLEDALRDGDRIAAVIKGFAVNNDGKQKIGYTAPSVIGQREVIKTALNMAEVEAESIQYVETHGTGTVLGDPVELKALSSAFASEKKQFCYVGSVKTNIGHLDVAAGMAGFIKTVLSLQHKTLPPSLHYHSPNPRIDFQESPFRVIDSAIPWVRNGAPLRAGVSSFGIGGTNAHLILEEEPVKADVRTQSIDQGRKQKLLLLSAKTPSALEQMASNLRHYLERNKEIDLADVAYTLQMGRGVFKYKRAVVTASVEEATSLLTTVEGKRYEAVQERDNMSVVFMFPGQGSQYLNMGKKLYETEVWFREEFDRCLELIERETGIQYKTILYPKQTADVDMDLIHQTKHVQPLLFCFEYALASLLMKWGIQPSAMIGHSLGEYVAACLSGVMTLEEAILLVVQRGAFMQSMPTGSMLSVQLSEAELREFFQNDIHWSELSIAVINSPANCVVAGPEAAVCLLEDKLTEKDCIHHRVHTSHAFHSRMMEPMVNEFRKALSGIDFRKPCIPYISNVSGTWIDEDQARDPEYWIAHLLSAVRFSTGVKQLLASENKWVMVEVGPGRTLSTFVRQHSEMTDDHRLTNLVKHPRESTADDNFLATRLAQLWTFGVQIDWEKYYDGQERRRISLPTYPFERRSFWIDVDMKDAALIKQQLPTIHGRERMDRWFYAPAWKQSNRQVVQDKGLPAGSRVLLFSNPGSFSDSLRAVFGARGIEVTLVNEGECYTHEAGQYTIRPHEGIDYDRLFDGLEGEGSIPDLIIQGWGSKECSDGYDRERELFSLLRITQSIGKRRMNNFIEIIVLTTGLHNVTGNEKLNPQRAELMGLVRGIPFEYVNVSCRNIDIVQPSESKWDQRLVRPVAVELLSRQQEQTVAYRGGHRWVLSYENVMLSDIKKTPSLLRPGGTYVVTGGLGGIGLAITEYLMTELKCNIILLARTMHSEKVKKAERFYEASRSLLILQADVTDSVNLERALLEGEKKFGTIHGVFHTAGLPDGGMLQFRTEKNIEPILAPKVAGTLNLYRYFENKDMDFMLLCSSISSVLAPVGQAAYGAANSFLDAFAASCHDGGKLHVISVNWDTWRNTGMALGAENRGALKETAQSNNKILEEGMSVTEGIEALRCILDSDLRQVIVSIKDLNDRLQANQRDQIMKEFGISSLEYKLRSKTPGSTAAMSRDFEKGNQVEVVQRIWREHLGVERISVEDNFFDIGASSLDIIQVRIKLIEELGVEISIVDMYKHTTIASLSHFLNLEDDLAEKTGYLQEHNEIDSRRHNRLQQRKRQIRGGD